LPRAEVDQDLLYSLGSVLTVFRVRRNNAEERLVALVQGKKAPTIARPKEADEPDPEESSFDLEQVAADQIVSYLGRKFRGHELARLIDGILIAEGYRTYLSPPVRMEVWI
jgi:restriction system protein